MSKKVFKTDFKGFTYSVSVPSADFESESASKIKDKLQEYLKKWYGKCYKELIAKFQSDFQIETSNNKKADIVARYDSGYVSLEGSILQQINKPTDNSKKIKFPIAGTEKFTIIDKSIANGIIAFSKKAVSHYFAREIRDGWIKQVKELTSEEEIVFWNKNEPIIIFDMKMRPIKLSASVKERTIRQFISDEFERIVYIELTAEGKSKYNASGFCRGDHHLNEIRKLIVEKQIPIEVKKEMDGNLIDGSIGSWNSYIRRGLIEIVETLTFEEIKQRGFLTPLDSGGRQYKIEETSATYWIHDEDINKLRFNLYKLTAKGKIKYDEGIVRLLNKEETNRIEGKVF